MNNPWARLDPQLQEATEQMNAALGLASDDPERLRKMADYLEKFYRSELIMKLLDNLEKMVERN